MHYSKLLIVFAVKYMFEDAGITARIISIATTDSDTQALSDTQTINSTGTALLPKRTRKAEPIISERTTDVFDYEATSAKILRYIPTSINTASTTQSQNALSTKQPSSALYTQSDGISTAKILRSILTSINIAYTTQSQTTLSTIQPSPALYTQSDGISTEHEAIQLVGDTTIEYSTQTSTAAFRKDREKPNTKSKTATFAGIWLCGLAVGISVGALILHIKMEGDLKTLKTIQRIQSMGRRISHFFIKPQYKVYDPDGQELDVVSSDYERIEGDDIYLENESNVDEACTGASSFENQLNLELSDVLPSEFEKGISPQARMTQRARDGSLSIENPVYLQPCSSTEQSLAEDATKFQKGNRKGRRVTFDITNTKSEANT